MCTRYWRHAPSSCFQKKSSPRGFTGSRKSVCPVIFKRKITLRPVIFLIIKSLRPVIYGVQKSIRPAASWPAPFPINFANSLKTVGITLMVVNVAGTKSHWYWMLRIFQASFAKLRERTKFIGTRGGKEHFRRKETKGQVLFRWKKK